MRKRILIIFLVFIGFNSIAQNGVIEGFIFRDENNNGTFETVDLVQSAVTVHLFNDANGNGQIDSGDNLLTSIITASDGKYQFSNRADGDYIIELNQSDFPNNASYVTPTTYAVTINNSNTVQNNFGYTGDAIGCFAFAANGDLLYVFNRHSSTNRSVGSQSNAGNVQAMALTPNGKTLWAVNNVVNNNRLGKINQTTGQFSGLPNAFGIGSGSKGQVQLDSVFGISFDFTTGDLYGLSSVSGNNVLFKIDTTIGRHIDNAFGTGKDYLEVQQVNGDKENDDIAFNPVDGKLYALEQNAGSGTNGTFVTIDITNGNVVVVGSTNIDNLEGLTFSRNGNFIGTSGQSGPQPKAYFDIDETNGNISKIADFSGSGNDFESCACNSPNVNLAPRALNDAVNTPQATPVVIDVQANDIEPEGENLTTSILDSTENGSLILLNSDSIEYRPNPTFSGKDTLTYQVCDPNGNCDNAIAVITVTFSNSGPVALNDNDTTIKNMSITTDVQANDSDVDGDSLTTTIVNQPTNGTVIVRNDNEVRYTPNMDFVGSDQYTYQVCDPSGLCDQAQVNIIVLDDNNQVIARDDNANTPEDSTVTIDVQNNDECNISSTNSTCTQSDSNYTVTYNGFTNNNGNTTISFTVRNNGDKDLSNAAFELPTGETASSFSTQNYMYTVENPTNNPFYSIKFNANNTAGYKNGNSDEFTYTIDSAAFSMMSDIMISLKASTDTSLFTFNTMGCEQNSMCNLTTTIVNAPDSGTAIVIGGDSISYSPDSNFVGRDTLTYSVCDSSNVCDTAIVIINVTNVNQGPVARDDRDTTLENTAVVVDVQANDTDPDGDPLTTAIVTNPTNGTVTVLNGDSIRYTPNMGFSGTDNFTYSITDPDGESDNAVVTIVVLADNNSPIAMDDMATTPEDSTVTIDVQNNDVDPDGDSLITTIIDMPDDGTATVENADSITYTPNINFNGNDTLTYSVCDTAGLCDTAIVVITVTNNNTGPVAIDDRDTTQENTVVVIDVQENDRDADGDTLTTTISTSPSNGSVIVLNGDSIQYTPNMNFAGTDNFNYQICDPDGECDIATVTVVVIPNNNAPIANDDFENTPENTSVTVDVQENDNDPENDPLTTTISDNPTNGTATVVNGDSITFTPNNNFSGRDSLEYSVCDPSGLCDTAIVVITVTNVNQGPVARDDRDTTLENTAVIVDVQANDVDADGDDLTTAIVTNPSNGTVTVLNGDSVQYAPNMGFNGTDVFTYSITDPSGASDQATVTIVVLPVNNAPTANDDFENTPENTSVTVDVQENDVDPDGDNLTSTISDTPNNGTATVVNGDSITYTPNMNFNGNDTLRYSVCDPSGLCDTAIVVITVTNVNQGPIAVDDRDTTLENIAVVVDVQANDTDVDGDDLNTAIVTNPSNGSVTVLNGDSVQYTPNMGFNGTDVFTYSITDSDGQSDQATVTIVVLPVNNAPTANDDFENTPENTTVTIDVQENDIDPDGDNLTTTISVSPDNGTATVVNGDSITYTPNMNFNGSDTLEYSICDPSGLCDTAIVVITVTNVNQGPVAVDDRDTTLENTAVVVNVQANDFDADGDNLTTAIATNPANGTVSVLNGDSVQYTPNTGFNGTDVFTYSITDPSGASDQATVTIVVLPVNNAPIANDDFSQTPENTNDTIAVLNNDTDPENDPLTVTIITPTDSGMVTVVNDTVIYTPDPNFNGNDTLTYSACDPSGLCATATVVITVNDVNNNPIARNDRDTTLQNTPITVDVQDNDTDPNGDVLTTTIINQPSNGLATVLNGDSIIYTPNPNFVGTDVFTYQICDPSTACDQATVTIVVLPNNNAPIAVNDFETTPENTPVTIDVQENDNDPDGDLLITTISDMPNNGNAVVVNADSITYTPNSNFNGRDTLRYSICDPLGLCDTASVIIRVSSVNQGPFARNDRDTTLENTAVITDVQANDFDQDGDQLTSTILTQPANGTALVINGDSIQYTPNANFNGIDTYNYQVCDNAGACASATVTIVVLPLNSAPVAVNDFETTPENTPVTVDVQENDSDPDGDLLVTTISNMPNNGNAVVVNADSITYTPNPNFNGRDTLSYSICDPSGLCDTASVIIRVSSVNQGPIARNDRDTTLENTAVITDVQANDFDQDGDVLTTTITSQPSNGAASVVNGDSVQYTPNANFNGIDTYSYQVCDNSGACATATVTIVVLPLNNAPVAVNDFETTPENTPITIDVQENDSDPDMDVLTTSIVNQPSNGIAIVVNADSITYTPNNNFNGRDTLSYRICDVSGLCDTALVIIRVTPVNNAPFARNDRDTTLENTAVVTDVQTNDFDLDNDVLTTTIVSQPSNGSVTVVNGDSIQYTPTMNFSGIDTYTYQVCDGSNACDQAVVTIVVLPLNLAPTAINDFAVTPENTPITVDVQSNDTDPDMDVLITSIVNQPSNGIAIVVNGDSITYTPNNNFNGRDTLTYRITDPSGLSDTALVIIRVTSVNQGPIARNDRDTTLENTPVITDVQANDFDQDGDVLTTTIVSQPTNGSITVINADSIQYTPTMNFSGIDTYTYQVCDGSNACDQAIVTIVVLPLNNAPTAINDFAVTPENTPITVDVQSNDTDPDMDVLITSIVNQPSNGNAVVVNTDSITYTPANGFNGRDTLTYRITDPSGLSDTALVIIRVTSVNQGPIARNDRDTTLENTPVITDVQANDFDQDGDVLTTTIVSQPTNGSVAVVNADSIQYTPNMNFSGVDVYSYQVCDGSNVCDQATVTIVVIPVNSAPTAVNDFAVTPENTPVTVDVQDNDSDPENDILITTIESQPSNGVAVIVNADSITYTPANGFNGRDTLTYRITDPSGLSDTALVIIRVFNVNSSPAARNDFETTPENVAVTVDVQANDTDPENDVLVTTLTSQPTNGTAVVVNADSITYTPNNGFNGNDFFNYRITDPSGASDIATVRILVISTNQPPVALNDTVATPINTPIIVDVQANDSDPDGDPLTTVAIVSSASNGTTSINNGNRVTYIPNTDYFGTDQFTYQVCDGKGNCANAVVFITIDDNLPPIAINDSVRTLVNTDINFNSLANDSDPNGDVLTIRALNNPRNGVVLQTNNVFNYSPRRDYTGTDQFDYEICDGKGLCDSAIVFITINQNVGVPFIPTGITPNGDGSNDVFIIENLPTNTTAELIIINRWGMKVYSNSNYDNSWKGDNMDGEELPDGTYFTVVKLSDGRTFSKYLDLRR